MSLSVWILVLCAILLVWSIKRWNTSSVQLPDGCRSLPGPKGIPWLGPVNQLPRLGTWYKFFEWTNVYGPIYSIQLLGKTHVFIGSQDVAAQLLGSRSAIFSGRPKIATIHDSQSHTGTAEYLPLMSKNKFHARHKKANHIGLAEAARSSYHDHPSIEAKRLIWHMSQDCSNWVSLMEDMTSRVISRLAWGSPDFAEELKYHTWNLLIHISPAGFLTNLISPLMKLPLLLSPWKRAEKTRHDQQKAWFTKNMHDVAHCISQGTAAPSYMRSVLEANGRGPIKDFEEGAFAVGMLAVTAVFTVSSPMQTFIRAVVLFPDWLQKIQAELDTVCGGARMPEVCDIPNLPVLRAFLQECLRWRPPIPGGIPHELESETGDIFNGYFIPPGSAIHPLEYAITHDPILYPDPDTFNPGRWLDPSFPTTYREPLTQYPKVVGFSSFGWGRRYCQGQELTLHELIVACGGIAWAFDIMAKGKLPSDKMEVPEKWDQSLIIVKPAPFAIECKLRDEKKQDIICQAYDSSKSEEVDVLRGFGAVKVE